MKDNFFRFFIQQNSPDPVRPQGQKAATEDTLPLPWRCLRLVSGTRSHSSYWSSRLPLPRPLCFNRSYPSARAHGEMQETRPPTAHGSSWSSQESTAQKAGSWVPTQLYLIPSPLWISNWDQQALPYMSQVILVI